MNAKSVWGVVLILLGVFFVLSSLTTLGEIQFFEDEITPSINSLSKLFGNSAYQFNRDINGYMNDELTKAKAGCFFRMILGILLSVIGTWMLKTNPLKKLNFDEEIDYSELTERKWRLDSNSEKENAPDDDTRWMPPEMRNRFKL